MLADTGIHLIHAAEPRHDHARATPRPSSETRSAGSAPSTGPSQPHRYLPDNAPATTPCASASRSPTAQPRTLRGEPAATPPTRVHPWPTPRRHRRHPSLIG
jgi:hypothetical protein